MVLIWKNGKKKLWILLRTDIICGIYPDCQVKTSIADSYTYDNTSYQKAISSTAVQKALGLITEVDQIQKVECVIEFGEGYDVAVEAPIVAEF